MWVKAYVQMLCVEAEVNRHNYSTFFIKERLCGFESNRQADSSRLTAKPVLNREHELGIQELVVFLHSTSRAPCPAGTLLFVCLQSTRQTQSV